MFKIVSSSAGSGKTYTLTKEYLKLALKGDKPHYFKRILAITFTKAATREMKERIMSKLQLFGEGKEDFMLDDIVRELHPETLNDLEGTYLVRKQEVRHRAKQIFTQVLHDYSDFSVMTIDSFVQRIVSAFTEELGLPFSFEVEMEADELLNLAVERMLERVGDEQSKQLTSLLEEFFLEVNDEGGNFQSLPASLANFAKNLTQEQSYSAIQKNEGLNPDEYRKIRTQLKSYQKRFENYIAEFGRKGLDLIEREGLIDKDFSYSTVFNYFKKSTLEAKIADDLGSRETEAFKNDKGWYTKTAPPHIKSSIETIKPDLVALFEQIETSKSKFIPNYLLYKQLTPHLYHLSLLAEIKVEFDKQLRENNRVHISEFNQKILQIITNEPVPFIYERLGEKYNHILIDEFQDTSKLQFANLLPLIDNSLGYNHFNLAVGDSKQAIYRFRGGDMDQIIALYNQYLNPLKRSLGDSELTLERLDNIQQHLTQDNLTTNRRSAKEIIEFNNTFFKLVAELYAEEHALSALVFDENFQQQVPPSAPTGGSVSIELVEADDTDSEEDTETPLMVKRTLEIIEEVRGQGYQQQDISVLCRSKIHAKQIANSLKERGLGVISEDSLSLKFSGVVNLITAFMKVLIKPDNKLAKYEAFYLFYQVVLKKVPDNDDNKNIKAAVEAPDVRKFYEAIVHSGQVPDLNPFKLLQLGVYELTEKLAIEFRLFDVVSERDYLFRFLDLVMEYSSRKGTHLIDFLDYWNVQKEKISISAPSDPQAVTVQTIHKSKGLEYPVVIVPYTDWQFTPKAFRDKLWLDLQRTNELSTTKETKNDENLVVKTETTWLKAGSVSLKADLNKTPEYTQAQYQDELSRMLVENMNLLYVALTRPTQHLYILAHNSDFDKKKEKVNYWLFKYLEACGEQPTTTDRKPLSNSKHTADYAHWAIDHVPMVIANDRSRDMRLRRQAERLFDVETFEQKKDHGNKVHYALSLVKTQKDIEAATQALKNEGLANDVELLQIEKSIESIIQHPSLKPLFIGDIEVMNEREILTPDGAMHRPDRVVRLENEVVILDYKTGQQAESHQKQLKKYIKLYESMGHENVSGKLVYLDNQNVEVVAV